MTLDSAIERPRATWPSRTGSRGILVAGDSLENVDELRPVPDRYNIDPGQHRQSIRKLANYEYEVILFGHGEPVLKWGTTQVRALADRL